MQLAARAAFGPCSEWYVELVLLHMLSFQGEYSNRIKHRWVGEIERVPWA